MNITNTQNLPQNLVNAIKFDDRDTEGSDYTITELLQPPRIVALSRIYKAKLTEDASDRLWVLFGKAGHEVLRRAAGNVGVVEQRAVVEVEACGRTFKISGQLDYGETEKGTLDDFKFVSVWAIKEACREDWMAQLNLYRWLSAHYGVHFEKIRIIAIARDWNTREAQRDPQGYPQKQVRVYTPRVWAMDECERFVKQRIEIHERAKLSLPLCTDAEVWAKPTTWAVMKPGRKRAVRVYYSKEEAYEHLADNAPGLEIETRPGSRPRCESYCAVSKWCRQWHDWQTASGLAPENLVELLKESIARETQ